MSNKQETEKALADLPTEPQETVSISADEADSIRGGGKNEAPTSHISLSFAKLAMEYKTQ